MHSVDMNPQNPNASDSADQHASKEAEINAQKDMILKQILDSDALMRLGNIKMVKPDLSNLVENYLVGMASQGRIPSKVTDDQLKQILLSLQQPKREFKINHK
jgi:programmed cell death protein 5